MLSDRAPEDIPLAIEQLWRDTTKFRKRIDNLEGKTNLDMTTKQMWDKIEDKARSAFNYVRPIILDPDTNNLHLASNFAKWVILAIKDYINGLEMLLAYKFSELNGYKKLTYTSGDLTAIDVYTDSGMGTKLFAKTLSYTSGDLTEVETVRQSDSKTLTKTLTYVSGDLDNIELVES